MRALSSRVDLDVFIARVRTAAERVLMLDYDGTLAPFHVRPDLARPYPEVSVVLRELVGSEATRVVVVSGRPAAELPPLLALPEMPEIWGSHGWERLLPDGAQVVQEPPTESRVALERAAIAVGSAVAKGARLERKLASIALHWRGLPDEVCAAVRDEALARWEELVEQARVELLPFDGGLELRALGCSKRDAVESILSETPERAAVAYLGDDITDEDAFAAVKPKGVAVLVRPQLRETAADAWIRPPEELVQFLRHWRVST